MFQVEHVREFINLVKPFALQVERTFSVPASISIAVSALETGWGRYVKGNSYFGIKGKGQTFVTHEFIKGEKISMEDSFRAYENIEESFLDFGRFLNSKRYEIVLSLKDDPERFAHEMQAAGYATDPNWAKKVISIMRGWNLLSNQIPDVPEDSPYYEGVKFSLENEFLFLNPDGNFSPDSNVSRGELAEIILKITKDRR